MGDATGRLHEAWRSLIRAGDSPAEVAVDYGRTADEVRAAVARMDAFFAAADLAEFTAAARSRVVRDRDDGLLGFMTDP